jgi:hypothetical protein
MTKSIFLTPLIICFTSVFCFAQQDREKFIYTKEGDPVLRKKLLPVAWNPCTKTGLMQRLLPSANAG